MATALKEVLGSRLEAVEERLQAACRRAGRPRTAVTLVAVTKTIAPELAALLPELSIVELGENRPQELWRKAALLPAGVHWHLIGHLQRNKIARTLPLVRLIHSVDSARLLDALEQEAACQAAPVPVLLEVNTSRESSKHGFSPEELAPLGARVAELRHVQICGLMTMAAYDPEPQRCRPTFAELRTLRDRLSRDWDSRHRLEHLSMGMSNDYEIAVEEGATLVRVGSALFEGLG